MKLFKSLFLPVGMFLAAVLAFIQPAWGIWLKSHVPGTVFIILIFYICGWQTNLSEVKFDRKFIRNFLLCAAAALFIVPLASLGLGRMMRLEEAAVAGLLVISCVPPTLSSGIVMTSTAGGNTLLAMMMTIFYNLAGVLTMPLLLSWCIPGDSGFDIKPWKMFLDLLLQVLLPFFCGYLTGKLLRRKAPSWSGYIPSICVILLILSFFSAASGQFRAYGLARLLLPGCAALIMKIFQLFLFWYGGKLLKMNVADRKSAVFTAGSKSLTIALTLLAIMNVTDGSAVIPCMVFYFLQSLTDSSLASVAGKIR